MGIIKAFFEIMKLREIRFKSMPDMLHCFLEFLDLDHPDFLEQKNRYMFIATLKLHVGDPIQYRLPNWRRWGLYDTYAFETDMDVDSGDSTDSDDVMYPPIVSPEAASDDETGHGSNSPNLR